MQQAPASEFVYNEEWLKLQPTECGERALMGVFAHIGFPHTLLDLGCGPGHLVKLAAKLGIPSLGVDVAFEQDSYAQDHWVLLRGDLQRPLDIALRLQHLGIKANGDLFDLVLSWETGEHLPEESADIYVDTIAKHTANTLVFTAGIPGQGGDGHINCQPFEYWREKLEAKGLDYIHDVTEQLRETWKWTTGGCIWYPQNVQVFQRGGSARNQAEV